jgi:hypothetical protein
MSKQKDTAKEVAKDVVIKSGSSAGAAILPYAAVGIVGYIVYKKYAEDTIQGLQGAGDVAGGVIERITNTTTTIKDTVNNIVDNTQQWAEDKKTENKKIEDESFGFTRGTAQGVRLPNIDLDTQKFISKYSVNTGVGNVRESPILDLGLGPAGSSLKMGAGAKLTAKDIESQMSGITKTQSYYQASGLTPMAAAGVKKSIKKVEDPKKPKPVSAKNYNYKGTTFNA